MNTRTRILLVIGPALVLVAVALLLSCGDDKAVTPDDTSAQNTLWLNIGSNVLVVDGETLEAVDTLLFGPYSYNEGYAIPGTRLVVLTNPDDGSGAATWVVDTQTLDTVSIRTDIGDQNAMLSPDGKYLAIGYSGPYILSLPSLETILELSQDLSGLAFDPEHDCLLSRTIGQSDSLLRWDLTTNPPLLSILKVPSPDGTTLYGVGPITYIPHDNNLAVKYAGDPKSGVFELDLDSFHYVRDWLDPVYPVKAMSFIGDSKLVRVLESPSTWTNNGNFWLELVDQASLAVEKTITQAEILQYITGNFSADVRALEVSEDREWLYLAIPDGLDDGCFLYKIRISTLKIDRVKYLTDAHCRNLLVFAKE